MATCKIKKFAAELSVLICASASCFLLTFGCLSFAKDNDKVLNYVLTVCEVRSATWKIVKHTQFYTTFDRYVAAWCVNHEQRKAVGQGTKQYASSASALAEAIKYEVGTLYSCWYDQRSPNTVQWGNPNLRRAIALLTCGALSVCLSRGSLFLTYRFIRENEREVVQNQITRIHVTFLK